jgi:PAS domain S-box-containing protein
MKKSIENYISGFRGGGTPQISEFAALLDLLPQAALLVETTSQKIIHSNKNAVDLLQLAEIKSPKLTLKDLVRDWDIDDLPSPDQQGNSLIAHSHARIKQSHSRSIDVQFTYTLLPPDGERGLILLEPELSQPEHQEHSIDKNILWDKLIQLSTNLKGETTEQRIDYILQIGHDLTNASTLAVYIADNDSPTAYRLTGYGKLDWLPRVLSPEDMIRLRAPYLWKPGKRMLSVIHSKGINNGIKNIATAPLGNGNAAIGTLIIADTKDSRSSSSLDLSKLLAAKITSIVQVYAIRSQNVKTIEEQEFEIKVGIKIQESIREGLLLLNPDLTVEKINHTAETMLGYTLQEAKGQPVELILIGSESVSPILRIANSGVSTLDIGEIRLYRRSGEEFPAVISVIPISNHHQVLLLLILVSDLSEQELIQEQAQQLEEHAFLGELMAIFAHEVRNPINNISTGLELMALDLTEQDPNRDIIHRLQGDCDRLEDLTKSILTFSKPNEYTMVQVEIEPLLKRMLDHYKQRMVRFHIEPQLQVEEDIPEIRGNFRALEQVFTNLISNAIQAMSETGGRLAVKIQVDDEILGRETVQISIADTGPGIPDEDIEHLFQPFYTTKRTGTGLGLAISKRIITAHKGTINVKSFPGGTIFQVRIPAAGEI